MIELLHEIHEEYRERLETKAVLLGRYAIEDSVELLRRELGRGSWLLVCDEHTWAAAGERTAAALDAAGQSWIRWDVPVPDWADEPVCDEQTVAMCRSAILAQETTAALAVGSGTINDIAKFGAYKAGFPAGCIATAPSMNGYTSAIAAVLTDGVKTTQPCTPTRVVVGDVDVLAAAPAPLIQSGIGDLASKPVSNADWIIANRLTGSTHSTEAAKVIDASWKLLDGVAPGLARRDREAVEKLTASLILSGFAMAVAGNSAPASGGEHLISHYIDMLALASGETHDLHGRQVGVATVTAAFFYQKLRALDPATIDPDALADRLAPWDEYRRVVEERFGSLSGAVLSHAEAGYPDRETLRARIASLKAQWESIMKELADTLREPEDIEAELRSAGAPVRYAELGVTRERSYEAIAHSEDIRGRYTILDLLWELGYLEGWAEEAVARYYE
ncbi:MAG: iron-containing alcohol dehydrogenase [Alkalispirochaetaceae bacterium]